MNGFSLLCYNKDAMFFFAILTVFFLVRMTRIFHNTISYVFYRKIDLGFFKGRLTRFFIA